MSLNQIINKMDNQSVEYRVKIYKSTIGQIFVIHSVCYINNLRVK
jgi:hypothetical protein